MHHATPLYGPSRTLHLEVVELSRLRARHQLGPVHGDALQRARRVEGAALLEAQRRAVALGDLAGLVERGGVALALLQQREGACREEGARRGAFGRGA